ncbi:hypothetical protein HZC32_00175 [Candidatus Woesearchaeota archaeon]|nr:hypothetical protein [Candidatus Woesearchaeota archaeon]
MEAYLQKNLVINNRELKYRGIFRIDELLATIDNVLKEKGYQNREKRSEEMVAEAGKKTYIELRPYKVKTNYATLMIKIKITFDNTTETTETIDDEKKKFQQGDVHIAFDAWSLTDYANRWGMKPWFYFVKRIINKYLYQFPLEGSFIGELIQDTAYVYVKIKRLLNSYKIESGKFTPEEEIKKQVEEEVQKEIQENARNLQEQS